MTEEDIRKNLFKYLSIYFPHLTPFQEEEHVKFDKQYGFIDILAKDESGNFVIIELKKSNIASRQAIHEVLKYTEFLKETYAINDDEIKIIIMSTEWKELFIPFSKFCFSNNMFEIEGIKLDVDNNGIYKSHSIVKPMKINNKRIFSPEHVYCFYDTQKSLENGLKSFTEILKIKEIFDYILFVLKRPNNVNYPHNHKFIIYFAMLRKTEEEYEEVLSELDPTGEAIYLARSSYHNNGLSSYEKSLNLTHPFPESDDALERGKPLYFDMLTLKEKWGIEKVIKYGRLNNDILSDDSIIDEVLGYTGNGNVIYQEKFYITDKRKYKKVTDNSKKILSNNPVWRNQFLNILSDIEEENNELQIEIYNPTNILLSIYQEIKFVDNSTGTSLPFFHINILNKNISYIGTLLWNKDKEYSLDEILKNYYVASDLDKEKGFFMCSQTNHIIMNDEILKYLNLEYNTLKIEDNVVSLFYNGIFKNISTELLTIFDFIQQEKDFCMNTVKKFENHILEV